MPRIVASVSQPIAAPADAVYRVLADYRDGHPRILPTPPFGKLIVEQGGTGAGTIIQFEMKVLGAIRVFRARITEEESGRTLVETDLEAGTRTTFTVAEKTPASCVLTIATEYQAPGLRGWLDRLLAPPYLRAIYRAEIGNLERLLATTPR